MSNGNNIIMNIILRQVTWIAEIVFPKTLYYEP